VRRIGKERALGAADEVEARRGARAARHGSAAPGCEAGGGGAGRV